MTKKTDHATSQMPQFTDVQDAAEFWDNHSPLDYPDHFREVEISSGPAVRKKGFTVKLEQRTIDQLASIAREQGIGPSTLARMWILEHLRARPADSDAQHRA